MLNNCINTIEKKGIHYIVRDGKVVKYQSWLGDLFAGRYDSIMENNVFPNLFGSSFEMHNKILKDIYKDIHDQSILELGTGNGNAAVLLNRDNRYTGIDISKKLLTRAVGTFNEQGFLGTELYLASADELLFVSESFDVCICNLSLNFFPNVEQVIAAVYEVLKYGGMFICSVPVSERNQANGRVRGTQFTEEKLRTLFGKQGFRFEAIGQTNGALLYFKAYKE